MYWSYALQLLHFLAAVIYVFLAVRVYTSNRKSTLNRSAVGMLVCFALWSFGLTLMSMRDLPPSFIQALWRVYPAGWITYPVFAMYLCLFIAEKDKLYGSLAVKITLVSLPAFFFIVHSNNLLMNVPVLGEYGWYPAWKRNIWAYLFYAYFIYFSLYSTLIVNSYAQKTESSLLRKICLVTVRGSAAAILSGTVIELIIPLVFKGQTVISQATDIFILFWAFSIMYAVTAYGFFRITLSSASSNIIANMNEFLILVNENMQIEYANKLVLDFLGYKDSELAGKNFSHISVSNSEYQAMLKKVLKEGTCRFAEFGLKRSDGAASTVILSASLLKETGDIVGIVFVASDISEIKKAQVSLTESYERLKEVDRLKSNFTSIISHELRTPLTSINGFLRFLISGIAGPITEQQHEYLEIIMNNSRRLLSLINDLLDLSKMESGKFTITRAPVEIGPLLGRCVTDVRSLAESKNILITAKTSDPGTVLCIDESRISQTVMNLLSNAIKFSRKDSKITLTFGVIASEMINPPSYATGAAIKPGNYGLFSVLDEGMGIESNKLGKIFDRFYQIENADTRRNPGTGLGLSIVSNIVEQHGGSAWAESEGLNKGAEFKFIIPAENSKAD